MIIWSTVIMFELVSSARCYTQYIYLHFGADPSVSLQNRKKGVILMITANCVV